MLKPALPVMKESNFEMWFTAIYLPFWMTPLFVPHLSPVVGLGGDALRTSTWRTPANGVPTHGESMVFQEGLVEEAPQLKQAVTQCGTVAAEYVTMKYVEGSLDISMAAQMLSTEAPLTLILAPWHSIHTLWTGWL